VASRLQICCHFIAYALYGGPLAAGGNSHLVYYPPESRG
jgi:hypothetical protein